MKETFLCSCGLGGRNLSGQNLGGRGLCWRSLFLVGLFLVGLFCVVAAFSHDAATAAAETSAAESLGAGPTALSSRGLLPNRSQPEVLVDPGWLAERLCQPDLRILELGKRDAYDLGHIPQAAFVDWISDITDPDLPERYNVLSGRQMEQLLSRLGVGKKTTVVLYDRLANRLATRMFWSLRLYGHQQIEILNGGGNAWSVARQPLVTEVPTFAHTKYRVDPLDGALQADRAFIKSQLAKPQFALVDGRPTGQYTGQLPGKVFHTGKPHARRGHLPQAVNIPWQENLTADGRFKSVNRLRKIYNEHGVTPESTVVTYCNEGLHAAHPWFVLTELLGYRQVRLYDDSLSEWANTSDAPLVTSRDK